VINHLVKIDLAIIDLVGHSQTKRGPFAPMCLDRAQNGQ
jgi:hypothetical protein